MALVKKSTLGARAKSVAEAVVAPPAQPRRTSVKSTGRKAVTAAGRIDQATQELASGLGEASAATLELQHTMDHIASSAEEAAGAAQESLGLIASLGSGFKDARDRADEARQQTDRAAIAFGEIGALIDSSVAAITLSAQRQLSSVELIDALEAASRNIDAIGAEVADVSDQTSLLALNAAIEAARAGSDGVGFSLVADEVRAIAEASEAGAGTIRALSAVIAQDVLRIAEKLRAASVQATEEAQAGSKVVSELAAGRDNLVELGLAAQDILQAASESELAAREAERGAEQVASAAEEQTAAAAEARRATEQQAISLEESQKTAEALAKMTGKLQDDGQSALAEQVAAAAEQLSATVQELSGSATQILTALDQIGRGTDVQAAATAQSNAAIAQIEAAAQRAQDRAALANESIVGIVQAARDSAALVNRLANGVASAIAEINAVLSLLSGLHSTSRKIETITDRLALAAVQTSMLAVSGAVEATRAGQAGRGFALVSADIRKLSRGAADSSERGKEGARDIQDQIATIRRELEQVVGAAEAEIERNRAMVERFAQVVAGLETAREKNGVILTGAQDILRAVREIQSGTRQIAEAADLASVAARDASAAARQQSEAAEALAASIEDIASIATVLAAGEA
ncbi:methyl-accepting chemotaxis protein [Novosphingobium sp.]|uniref:methyl-accepting chemotaxis protein n=1 Tax=Novosphingobium sp. TaxID=1874826 RepID=UPI0031CF2B11